MKIISYKKRFLSGLLVFAILLSMLSMMGLSTALAVEGTGNNFQAGEAFFDKLEDAISAVPNNGTILMLQDVAVDYDVDLNINKTYTFDLGGNTFRGMGNGLGTLCIWSGNISITNGTINADFNNGIAVQIFGGTTTLSDLTVTASKGASSYPIEVLSGTLNILSGNYYGVQMAIYCRGGRVNITTGVFASDTYGCIYTSSSPVVSLTSGSTANVTNWLNGARNVVISPPAKNFIIGDTYYHSLADAIIAVRGGGTITMLQDVSLSGSISLTPSSYNTPGKVYTLDLNGFTISSIDNVFTVSGNRVYIKNGSITAGGTAITVSGTGKPVLEDLIVRAGNTAIDSSNSVTIRSGDYYGESTAVACSAGVVTISSGHFSCAPGSSSGCIVNSRSGSYGLINLTSGSETSVANWLNSAKDVTITNDASIDLIPVTGISGVPMAMDASIAQQDGVLLQSLVMAPNPGSGAVNKLGTVEPSNASHKEIEWSITRAGRTGATIENVITTTMEFVDGIPISKMVLNTYLTAKRAGTLTLTATIVDGIAIGKDYTQDFVFTVMAEGIYDVWCNGERFSSDNLTVLCGDGTAVYEPSTNTLTLTDATISTGCAIPGELVNSYGESGIFTMVDLNIVLIGNNVIEDTGGTGIDSYGTEGESFDFLPPVDVSITGSGSLSITETDTWNGYGFYILGSLSIDGVTMNINSAATGLWVAQDFAVKNSLVNITNSAELFYGIVVGLGEAVIDKSVLVGNRQPIEGYDWPDDEVPFLLFHYGNGYSLINGSLIITYDSSGSPYYEKSRDGIISDPEDVASWAIRGEESGIEYNNGDISGFVAIPDVTVIPITHTYTVSFDVDGDINSVAVEEGEKAVPPAAPVKDGFTFVGWYLNDAAFDFDTLITGDITLTAKWEAIHVHDFAAVVTAPTCTEQGYTTHTCSCGESFVADYLDALGHDYAAVITVPTCTEQGYTTHTCSCGESYVADYVDALGHDWDDGVVTTEPTEYDDGVMTFTCSVCRETYTVTIPKLSLLTVSVTTPSIVETLAAYLNITVIGDDIEGKTLIAYLKVGEELRHATPINNGSGRMYIDAAPVSGYYELVVIAEDKTAAGSCPINVIFYNTDIWVVNATVTEDGFIVLLFNEVISAKDGKFDREVKLNGTTINCELGSDDRSLITNVKEDELPSGNNIFTAAGVKYQQLFPSYSFTFTAEVVK